MEVTEAEVIPSAISMSSSSTTPGRNILQDASVRETPKNVSVAFRSRDGRHTDLSVSSAITKTELTTRLVEIGFAEPGCRLVLVKKDGATAVLDDRTCTLASAGDNVEMLVLEASKAPAKAPVDEVVVTEAMIMEATASIKPSPRERSGETARTPFEDILRMHGPQLIDIVSMLLKISRTIQSAIGNDGDDAAGPASSEPEEEQAGEEEVDPYANVDQDMLNNLCVMGFPENRAKKALVLCEMNAEAAAEWLLVHDGDPDIDEPLAPPPKPIKNNAGSTFTPDPKLFRMLIGMGFVEKDILAALQLTRNNFESACDWLLGSQDVHAALAEQLKRGIDINSPLIKEALKDARIQAGLADPRMCKALKALAEDPERSFAAFRHDARIRRVIQAILDLLKRVNH